MTWQDWLNTYLHQKSFEIISWLRGQGIGHLTITGLEQEDWPVFKLKQMLTYKGEAAGLQVSEEESLEDPSMERAVKSEVRRQRRKATKVRTAIRELSRSVSDRRTG